MRAHGRKFDRWFAIFLQFKDDFLSYVTLYFLKNKTEVKDCFVNYMQRLEKETQMKINVLRTDNGLEYVNKEMSEILFNELNEHMNNFENNENNIENVLEPAQVNVNEPRYALRDRRNLQPPNRGDFIFDFENIDELFIADFDEPKDYEQAVNSANSDDWR